MLTTHRLAYLCRQWDARCDTSIRWKLQGVSGEGILYPVLNMNAVRVTQIPLLSPLEQ